RGVGATARQFAVQTAVFARLSTAGPGLTDRCATPSVLSGEWLEPAISESLSSRTGRAGAPGVAQGPQADGGARCRRGEGRHWHPGGPNHRLADVRQAGAAAPGPVGRRAGGDADGGGGPGGRGGAGAPGSAAAQTFGGVGGGVHDADRFGGDDGG